MNGRDLIIYILQNHLEDEPVFQDDKILGFITDAEAAVKFGVGIATIRVWVNNDELPGLRVGEQLYIPANAARKNEANE